MLRDLVLHRAESRKANHQVKAFATRAPSDPERVSLIFQVKENSNIQWVPAQFLDQKLVAVNDRTDDLWKSTCFECFAGIPGDKSYMEWNFSPAGLWQAYEFEDYRSARVNACVEPPVIEVVDSTRFEIDLTLPSRFSQSLIELSLTAVMIEKEVESPFYWAIRHDAVKPDFHVRSSFSFLLEL
jgi:hypothetical protein